VTDQYDTNQRLYRDFVAAQLNISPLAATLLVNAITEAFPTVQFDLTDEQLASDPLGLFKLEKVVLHALANACWDATMADRARNEIIKIAIGTRTPRGKLEQASGLTRSRLHQISRNLSKQTPQQTPDPGQE
jgi:hypothetical protein